MQDTITASDHDEAHIKLESSDSGLERELYEYFTFYVPNYFYMPLYKSKLWDGKHRLYNIRSKLLHKGLYQHLKNFCIKNNYKFVDNVTNSRNEYTEQDIDDFFAVNPLKYELRDYQKACLLHCINEKRSVNIQSTGSGKSLNLYSIIKFLNVKSLVIVPTVALVNQMESDFRSYEEKEIDIQTISGGKSKDVTSNICISTWQSLYKKPSAWFNQFDLIMVDEAHLATGTSLTNIMDKATEVAYRFGFTGTIKKTQVHKLVLEGLFGPIQTFTTTAKLIEQKVLSDMQIKVVVLDHGKIKLSDAKYTTEISYLITQIKRNEIITKLAVGLSGITLVLFQYVDSHGMVLYDLIKKATDKPVYFFAGTIDSTLREQYRLEIVKLKDAIIVGSNGTISTGINIPNIANIIYASPTKSRIRALQSLGRGLRRSEEKNMLTVIDISDKLNNAGNNYSYKHLKERIKIYKDEKFKYSVSVINL